jgi:hypothetical protein
LGFGPEGFGSSGPGKGKERKIVDPRRFVYNEETMKPRDENFRSVFIYSDEMAQFEYSPTHPFKPVRARLTLDLCLDPDHQTGTAGG